jgi:hypothetical protein
MVESFWDIPDGSSFRTPLAILREQADALTKQTQNMLVGTVSSRPVGWQESPFSVKVDLAIRLDIEVPALSNYRYGLLTYWQPVTLYPGGLEFSPDEQFTDIADEQQFLLELKRALASLKARNLIGSLLSQAKAA